MNTKKASPPYQMIIDHYETCLENHGDNNLGVDWPDKCDAATRYQVMLDIVKGSDRETIIDFGCGAGHLLEYIQTHNMKNIDYIGLDISPKFIALCRRKWPHHDFIQQDVLEKSDTIPEADYIVMNGVFTEKCTLPNQVMFSYMQRVIKLMWPKTRKGLAVNVMSTNVDWKRKDLFHLSKRDFSKFLTAEISPNFLFREDYGLYEYTAYVHRDV
ncbi:MAG: SAM-dependent methyltransferase [Rhodospirillaceae bacterium]|nr:SAM-dependent methyltransferase [Rhodospirillaceae bacterium]